MANEFDQFDNGPATAVAEQPAKPAANPFDQFDAAAPAAAAPASPAANPFDQFDAEKDKTERESIAEGIAQGMSAGTIMPASFAKIALTKGGRAGDVAAEVLPAIGGAILGTVVEPGGGTAVGGAGGAAAGNTFAQMRQYLRGERKNFSGTEVALSAAAGAIPVPGLKPAATVLGTVAKTAGARALQGGVVAGASETARQAIDDEHMDPAAIAKAALTGSLFGGVLGAGEGAVSGVKVMRAGKVEDIPPAEAPGAMRAAVDPAPIAPAATGNPLPENAIITTSEMAGKRSVQIDIPGGADGRPLFSGSPEDAAAAGYQVPKVDHLPAGQRTAGDLAPNMALDATPEPTIAEKIGAGPGTPAANGTKPLGLVESAKATPSLRPEFKDQLAGYYEPQANDVTIKEANRLIDQAGGDLQAVKAAVVGAENPDAVTSAMGLQLVRKFQESGQLQDAADVLYNMAQKAKTQGQAIQILSTLGRSTPEGMANYAQKLFGRKLTGAELGEINAGMERVNQAAAPEVKLTRMATLLDGLQQKAAGPRGKFWWVPGAGSTAWDSKLTGAMNIAMLLNPKTIIRNVLGNGLMTAADMASDIITPAADAGVSIFTGRRTVGGPQLVEYVKGLAQPARDFKLGYAQAKSEGASGYNAFKEGVDTMAVMGKLMSTAKTEVGDIMKAYRSTFSDPLMKRLEKTMSVVMGSPDRAFYTARLRASLASQVKAAGAAVPTAEMVDQASLEAARAVYQDPNFISTALREVRNTANKVSTLGKSTRFGLGQAIVPFVQVPGSILMRGLEYSPAGFLKAAAESIGPLLPSKVPFNQREFSQAFGKALLGSTAIAGTGYMLGKLGIITGTPDPDPKVRALQRSMGFGAYSINVSGLKRAFQSMDWKTPVKQQPGDVFVNYDWAQPISFPAAMGASLAESEKRTDLAGQRGKLAEAPSRVLTALMSGARTVEEQPLLTGLTGFMQATANAKTQGAGMLEAMAQSMATLPGQYVPAVSRQVQQLMDNRVYATQGSDKLEGIWRSTAVNIPGLAKELGFKPRAGMFGDLAEKYQANGNSFFNVVVNPAFVTEVKQDKELNELYRLWQATGKSNAIPDQVDANITVNGKPKALSADERADYQQLVGRVTRDGYRQLMRSEGYSDASDEQRAKVLVNVLSAANTVAKIQLFGDRPRTLDRWDRALMGSGARTKVAMGADGQ